MAILLLMSRVHPASAPLRTWRVLPITLRRPIERVSQPDLVTRHRSNSPPAPQGQPVKEAAELSLPPTIQIERFSGQAPELPRLEPPPVTTGVFADAAVPAVARIERKSGVHKAGFLDIETSHDPSEALSMNLGSFTAAASGAGGAVRVHIAGVSGFSQDDRVSSSPSRGRFVSPGGFGDTSVSGPVLARDAAVPSVAASVEILYKPRPVYTDQARRLQIEGEVLLEVLFRTSGEIRICRVAQGLGHGLDEAAIAAARAIRFRATADSTAMIHIVFQLAY
jgi:TonB family protein